MLNIKTIKNPLVTDPTKDGYCFRSSCSQKISAQQLIKEMSNYNSSFTEADLAGMLSVLTIFNFRSTSRVVSHKLTSFRSKLIFRADISA